MGKSNRVESPVLNDRIPGRGQGTPKIDGPDAPETFSTDSLGGHCKQTMTTGLTLRKLKFAILQCLASGRHHQHKFNLIGKSYSQSPLESAMGIRFDAAQRHLAVVAFNELEYAELIRPTYTDSISPEEWVEITIRSLRILQSHIRVNQMQLRPLPTQHVSSPLVRQTEKSGAKTDRAWLRRVVSTPGPRSP